MTQLAARETSTAVEPPLVWIVDSSPFIVLAKVGHLDLLAAPGRCVLVVETVAGEIEAGAESDPARQFPTPFSLGRWMPGRKRVWLLH